MTVNEVSEERPETRESLAKVNNDLRIERFEKLRGLIKDNRFPPMTLQDFESERHEIWNRIVD